MKSLFRIFSYILHYKMLIFTALLCSFLYAGMNGASVYFIGPFLNQIFSGDPVVEQIAGEKQESAGGLAGVKDYFNDRIKNVLGSGTPRQVLTRLCYAIIVLIFLKTLFSYLHAYIMAYVEQGVVRNLRRDLYAAYHRLPLRYYQKKKTGELISRVISDCATVNSNLNSSFEILMKEPVSIAVLLFLMIVISWQLTVLTFLVAPPGLLAITIIGKKLRRRSTKSQVKIADMTSVLEETIAGIRVVKAFAMEPFEIERFGKANRSYAKAMVRLLRLSKLSPPVTELLGVGMAVVVLWIGGIFVLEKQWLEPASFLQFIVFMFMLMQSANKLSNVNAKFQVGIAASQRVFEIIDQPSEVTDPPDPLPIKSVENEIRLRDVWYEYEPDCPVLSDIDLTVKSGETIAIVGPSGGGKSTLVDLLPRFFDPVRGAVEIDGQDIRGYKIEDLRRLFGIVTQDTILFHDTIKANIAYGRPDISMEEIEQAAKTANAHDFIVGFEDGYDTVVGDRGTTLSGGQKQRLVIARAVLKNPPVLIFDEATSALDSSSEARVQSAIDRLMEGRTSFIIAHRLSTIASASRIIVIDNGKIVEDGTHKELYRNGQLYKSLYDLQYSAVSR